ncbi:MAG: UbiA family prenyltransferase [Mucilaginibacter polytrichastri]|nr:UbiA family prenyltransferase [Mucilaginibacter polytrichastri]
MIGRLIRFIFFGNYFIGILAVALSVEALVQLHLPLNSPAWYLLLFSATIMYYTFAYADASVSYARHNPRADWYRRHRGFVRISQAVFLLITLVLIAALGIRHFTRILQLPLIYWLMASLMLLAGIGYYGLLPQKFIRISLRSRGWIKPFVIGFVWSCCVTLLPVIMLHIEGDAETPLRILLFWCFIKNWMFCTVNAIMFDMKDYADDANRQLKTFVVRFGLRRTLYSVVIPLCLAGVISLLIFATYMQFSPWMVLINLIPFALLIAVAWSMHRKHEILYYLIVIDGLLLVKAICGILSMYFRYPDPLRL